MKAFTLWGIIALCGLSTTYLSVRGTEADPFYTQKPLPIVVMQEPVPETPQVPKRDVKAAERTEQTKAPHEVLQSVVRLKILNEEGGWKSAGSAILVGRERLSESTYRYYALTANHVVDDVNDNMVEISQWANTHAKADIVKVSLDTYYMIPASDWALMAFEIEDSHVWPTVQLATEAEFLALRAFDPIYGVGCDNAYGPLPRAGNFGLGSLQIPPKLHHTFAPFANPDNFFRPYMDIWFGASGGGIFNKDGKLIGLFNGIIAGRAQPATHMIVALKTHVVLDLLKMTGGDRLLVEEK